MDNMPKSYLTDADRERFTQSEIYLVESRAASDAGDDEAAWAWLRYADLPAYSLMTMKRVLGADFVREMDFLCINKANQAYGDNWLDA